MVDKFCREIMPGDLLKIPHYTAYNKRRIYLYKLVVKVNADSKIDPKGEFVYAVDVTDIARKGSLDKAHKCPLSVVGECEIIDCGGSQESVLFWERPRAKKQKA